MRPETTVFFLWKSTLFWGKAEQEKEFLIEVSISAIKGGEDQKLGFIEYLSRNVPFGHLSPEVLKFTKSRGQTILCVYVCVLRVLSTWEKVGA